MFMTRISLLCLGILLSVGSVAFATTVDVKDYSTQTSSTYFVDADSNKYNSPYYRWHGEDWGWQHSAVSGTITSATLNISAYDVDWAGQPQWGYKGELDKIYAYDGSTKVYLGSLSGENDKWSYTSFALGSNFFDDIASGLKIWMEIDGRNEGWAVTLAKSALSIDGGTIPNPNPGPSPVPEPGTIVLLAAGLGGLALWRRKQQK